MSEEIIDSKHCKVISFLYHDNKRNHATFLQLKAIALNATKLWNDMIYLFRGPEASWNLYRKLLYYSQFARTGYLLTPGEFDALKPKSLSEIDVSKILFRKESERVKKYFPKDNFGITLKYYYGAIKSFFGLKKAKVQQKTQLPNYIHRPFYFAIRRVNYKNEYINIGYEKKGQEILIYIPQNIRDNYPSPKNVLFYPISNKIFKISLQYEDISEKEHVHDAGILAVDLGVNVLAACVSDKCEPFLINGRHLKAINQFYNKKRGDHSSKADLKKKGIKKGEYIKNNYITQWRKKQIETYIHECTKFLIKLCLKRGINQIIIGENKGWKSEIDIGKRGNQRFVMIPYDLFKNQLIYKGSEVGISINFIEESYSSKTDHLAREYFYSIENKEPAPNDYQFIGKRIEKRGRFYSSTGKKLHDDINGAIGIARKFFGDQILDSLQISQIPCLVNFNDPL